MLNHKFSRKLLWLPILGAALVLINCHGSCGRHGDKDPHKRADKIVSRMEKELGLTAEQTVRVRKLAYEVADSMSGHMQGHEGMHGEMLKQLRAESVDTVALDKEMDSHAAEFQKHTAERHAAMIRAFAEFHDILTAEQRNKLTDWLEKNKDELRGHWGHGE